MKERERDSICAHVGCEIAHVGYVGYESKIWKQTDQDVTDCLRKERKGEREGGIVYAHTWCTHGWGSHQLLSWLACAWEWEREKERKRERERDSLRARMHIYGIEMHIYDVKKIDEGSCHNCFLDLRVLGKGRKREREREREREKDSIGAHMTHIGTRGQWGCEVGGKDRSHMISDYVVHTILMILCTRDNHKWTHIIDILSRCVHILGVQAYTKHTISDHRVAKTHWMPYIYRSFSSKEPYNQWLFCEKWPAA